MSLEQKVCKNFMYRNCNRENCKFLHDNTICFYYWKNGQCNRENNCERSHEFRLKSQNDQDIIKESHLKNNPTKNKDKYNKNKRIKNTECFEPMTKPVDMRILYDSGLHNDKFTLDLTSRDVILTTDVFNNFKPGELYNKLVEEIETCGIDNDQLLKMWHGNNKIEGTHLIADDKKHWKEKCPTFNYVVDKIRDYFNMDIQATRFNWYKDTSHWKPFHHDAAAVKMDKAKVQNFTVAVSFGESREAAFEHAKTKTVISMPLHDGCIYSFSKDTNIIWRHGILQDIPIKPNGRISIICWGSISSI